MPDTRPRDRMPRYDSPGNTGHNAFFYWSRVHDAKPAVAHGLDMTLSRTRDQRGDQTDTAALWLDYKVGTHATFDVSVTFERWRTSAETQALLGTTHREGITANDINFGWTFTLFSKANTHVALAGRMKFTAGEGHIDRRNTDRIGGYGAIAARHDHQLSGGATLSWLADLGFGGWDNGEKDDGFPRQDDLLRVSAAARFERDDWRYELGTYGGFSDKDRFNNGDRFYRVYGEARRRLSSSLDAHLSATFGADLNPDIPSRWQLATGVRFKF